MDMTRTAKWKDPCLRCGYCCKKGPCHYAEWAEDKPYECIFLKLENKEVGTYSCEIRDRIIDSEKESCIPMFDDYCSCPLFNDMRDKVKERKND